jgi:N-acetylglucosaminyldiphosphoundecaprenol N-acetyl-beta-D-mannosaminyltransferase
VKSNYTKNFLGIDFVFNKNEIKSIINSRQSGYICLVNANIVSHSQKFQPYRKVINDSICNVCDGSIIALLFNKMNKDSVSSYPGPDLFIEYIQCQKYKHAFIGSSNAVLESLKNRLTVLNPDIKESLFYSPPFVSDVNEFDYSEISDLVNQHKSDIIWVSLGAPKQEFFMHEMLSHVEKGVMIGVGAAFDFYSGYGNFKRAPKWMRAINLEWLYRVVKEPKKTLKRLANEIFWITKSLVKEIK